eukprot:TRINITY_DN75750_c0_g1_i1.p1 TRINITY_DN75750_c0_g1~~TRINITY_DN75750_c0_g1_i1.p1  ORF type:complete len:221 (+),score=68.47 TRINITY_DN75750_c0_g1_i1:103-765(+)
MPTIKLQYFAIEGVAEKIRLAFAIGGIDFEDERIQFPQWDALKPTTKYGQLPQMWVDGKLVAQSGAMLRYAGKLGGLIPEDDMKMLAVEEVIGLEEDIGKAVAPSLYIGMRPQVYGYPADMPKEEKSKIQLGLRATLMEGDLPKMLGYLENMLKENGTGWFVGDKPTIADCQVLPRLRHLTKGVLDGIPTTILEPYPELTAFKARMEDLPNVKAYYAKLG